MMLFNQAKFCRALQLCTGFLTLGLLANQCDATGIYLHLNLLPGNVWTVSAEASDHNSLGLYSFSLDVIGANGATVLRNNPVSQTNQAPGAPAFGQNRTNGTVNGTSVINIQASGALTDAFNNDDPSFLTFNLGQPGSPVTLAKGLFTGVGTITPQVSPGGFFQLFPSNYDADHPAGGDPGKVTHVVNADFVIFTSIPEPTSLLMLGIGSLVFLAPGCLSFARQNTHTSRSKFHRDSSVLSELG